MAPRQGSSGTEAARLAELSVAVRESTMKRLRAVPSGWENWRPTAGSLSVAEIAQHLIGADEWLFAKLANPELPGMKAVAGSVTVDTRSHFDFLLDRLDRLGAERARLLSELSERELDRRLPDDRFGGEVSVWWIIVRGNLDHEAHHRGQLATYLRMIGSPNEQK